MASQSAHNYTRLAVAIVVAAIVIGAGIVASSYLGTASTVTRTTTITSASTETITSANNVTITQTNTVIETNTTTIIGVSCAGLPSALCFDELSNISVTTPKFIAAENGLPYVFYANETSVGSTSGPGFNKTAVGLMYWAYGNQTVTVCSGAGTGRNILGELTVTIPLKDGLWIVSNMTIIPNDYIISCPTE